MGDWDRNDSHGRYWSVEECRWVPCPVEVTAPLAELPEQAPAVEDELLTT